MWGSSKEVLLRRLGAATGAALWQHAHGLDDRPVETLRTRRSVGAEVNWGVRLNSDEDAQTFLRVSESAQRCYFCAAPLELMMLSSPRTSLDPPAGL